MPPIQALDPAQKASPEANISYDLMPDEVPPSDHHADQYGTTTGSTQIPPSLSQTAYQPPDTL